MDRATPVTRKRDQRTALAVDGECKLIEISPGRASVDGECKLIEISPGRASAWPSHPRRRMRRSLVASCFESSLPGRKPSRLTPTNAALRAHLSRAR